jgi:hypothetical protein
MDTNETSVQITKEQELVSLTDSQRLYARQANERLEKVLKAMDVLARIADKSNGVLTQVIADQIINELEEKTKEVLKRFDRKILLSTLRKNDG